MYQFRLRSVFHASKGPWRGSRLKQCTKLLGSVQEDRVWVVKKTKMADWLLNLHDILFSTSYKGIVRFARIVLLECVHFDN